MYIDVNITKTKAFKEQLGQHSELYAPLNTPSLSLRDRLLTRISSALMALSSWLRSFVRVESVPASQDSA
jgi:hypothetical protein